MVVGQDVKIEGHALTTIDRSGDVTGDFVDLQGERYYVIRNVDKMPRFFASVISNDDHWLFISSTGGITAGRVSPETALFPYVTVDKIHDSASHTGSLTLLRVARDNNWHNWEPFSDTQNGQYAKTRNIYKNTAGNKLCFEEINHDLGLVFRYTWLTSRHYGFVRHCELENLTDQSVSLELLDGLQDILPAGTPRFTQTNSSNLVDAYKWTEFDSNMGLALFTLYSGITDRAEPCESLKANLAYCLGLDGPHVLISTEQLQRFKQGHTLQAESLRRGIRGAFLVGAKLVLPAGEAKHWDIIANTEQTQPEVIALRHKLADRETLATAIHESVTAGTENISQIMASGDAFQLTAEETVTTHHYANALFNVLRGGIFFDQNRISGRDLRRTIRTFNRTVYSTHQALLEDLPDKLSTAELQTLLDHADDLQLHRLCYEYLPITFGRRHGDPSRPWNQFAIRLRDTDGSTLLSYEGNWRDIFQNWEALAFSFPDFIEGMIAKFVNASTVDGYNPYRITKNGIDWEVEEPDDPWSYIGYWGDHQIIYLQKLLELSHQFHPERLVTLLNLPIFSYANVPYRIRPFTALIGSPKTTVDFDEQLAERIEQRETAMGADGRLLLDGDGTVYQVNLLEKLLVPLLAKLGNLVVDGGIWMNTQRPEWNDANNALVGHGLSMVTLCYLRRYLCFLEKILADEQAPIEISTEVAIWLSETALALKSLQPALGKGLLSPALRAESLSALGEAASRYREKVYRNEGFSAKIEQAVSPIRSMLKDALTTIDHSIATNRREDGMFHAYNLLDIDGDEIMVERLYPMLEGQVAALSAGSLPVDQAVEVIDSLFASEVYRPDQQSFMLYPDRELPSFLEKNCIPEDRITAIALLSQLSAAGDTSLIEKDAEGIYRFNADCINAGVLLARLDNLVPVYSAAVVEAAREPITVLYEAVFNHQAFTGRSGTMFGFEGLGCIYWHMVAKLLLAVQENYFRAVKEKAGTETSNRLGDLYYQIRRGIGFNKTPTEFGAFPTDPYSHTPRHSGARQPGMTGQVKEEILTRFGELGLQVADGQLRFSPTLLRRKEFLEKPKPFRFCNVDGQWEEIVIPKRGLAFTWCQVPIVYTLCSDSEPAISINNANGESASLPSLELSQELSADIFSRNGKYRQINLRLPESMLFIESVN